MHLAFLLESGFGVVALGTLLLSVLSTVFWIWMLIDCATNESEEGSEKLVWIIIIVLTHCIGALIYFIVRRPQRRRP